MTDTRPNLEHLSAEERRELLREMLLQRSQAPAVTTHPLSYGQKSLWMLQHLAPDSAAYNSTVTLRLRAATAQLDVERLKGAFRSVIERHAILRTKFATMDGVPTAHVHASRDAELDVIDASEWSDDQVTAYLLERAYRPFALEDERLDRWTLLRRSDTEHFLQFVIHHIVMDMWSGGLLMDEIRQIYDAESRGEKARLQPPTAQFVDFVTWQNSLVESDEGERLWEYWRQQIGTNPTLLEMPTDRPRPPAPTYAGAAHDFVLGPELVSSLKSLSRDGGVTLFTTLLAAFQVLLHRYSGQDDIIVGAPMVGRSQPWAAGAVGYFSNTLPMRGDLSGDPRFSEFLQQMLEVVLGGLRHQDYPFQLMQERLQETWGNMRGPLLRSMFALEQLQRWNLHSLGAAVPTAGGSAMTMGGLEVDVVPIEEQTAQFELMLMAEEMEDSISFSLKYNTDLYDPASMERLVRHFETLLVGIITDPDAHISELPLSSPDEIRELTLQWSEVEHRRDPGAAVTELFSEQVNRGSDRVAVAASNGRLTYRELDERSTRLAHFLAQLGVTEGTAVGLCLDRSLDWLVGVLGILKAGGAYVPLDPMDPPQRVSHLIEHASVRVLLTKSDLMEMLPESGVAVVPLDTDWPRIARHRLDPMATGPSPDSRACILFTSHADGPAGVELTHGNLVHAASSWTETAPSAGAVLFLASVSSGAALYEVWGPLLSGRTLVLYPPYRPTPDELAEMIVAHEITALRLSADALQDVARSGLAALTGIRDLVIEGDVTPPYPVTNAASQLQDCTVTCAFGDIECGPLSTLYRVEAHAERARLPLGRPAAGITAYVLDRQLRPAAVGVPGDLYIGGAGLARGYLGRAEDPVSRFVPHPFLPGERLYRTGERARFLPDGMLERCASADRHVRVEDFRVDPAEIEAALSRHQSVRECAVMGWLDDRQQQRLVAYVVSRKERSTESDLRIFLQSAVPEYMVPGSVVYLDALPRLPDGDVDRSSLPLPLGSRSAQDANFVAPETMLQSVLQRIWEEVLHTHPIGIRDDFFELGGHSFLALRLLERIEHVLGVQISPTTLGQSPTIEQLTAVIESESQVDLDAHLVTIQEEGTKPPFFFSRGHREGPSLYAFGMGKQLGEDRPYYILQPGRLDIGEEQPSIESLAARFLQEIKAIQPRGPYYLGGHCEGGVLAFEMARQLEAAGEQVGMVVLVNTVMWLPEPRWPFVLLQRVGSMLRLTPARQVALMIGVQEATWHGLRLLSRARRLRRKDFRLRNRGLRSRVRSAPRNALSFARAQLRPRSESTETLGPQAASSGPTALEQYEAQKDAVWDLHARAVRAYVPSSVRAPVRAIAPADEPWRRFRDMKASEASTQMVAPNFDIRRFPGKRAAYVVPHRVEIGEQIRDWLDSATPDSGFQAVTTSVREEKSA